MKTSPYRDAGGRWRVRVRDEYVRDVVRPMIERNGIGVAKLDFVLRGLAAREVPGHGMIPCELSWENLHDMCRDRQQFLASDIKVKRGWVSDKLARLEALGLIERGRAHGYRSDIRVLSDRGDGSPLDDPGAVGAQYVTILGGLIEFGHLGMWSAPEVAAYLAAMHAERHTRADEASFAALHLEGAPRGGGRWFRALHWFGDGAGQPARPETHVRYGFSERTLQRGIAALEDQGLMLKEHIYSDPRTGRPFELGRRILYHNGFDELLHTPAYRRRRLQERCNLVQYLRGDRLYQSDGPRLVV